MHSAADRTVSPSTPVRVLYVAGVWHNGSTIAGSVLGGADGAFFAGEVREIFGADTNGEVCGCGAPVAECELWARIAAAAGLDAGTRARLALVERRLTRNRDLPRILLGLRGRGPLAADVRELTDALGRLYRAIADETGCRVIVDSSKWPLYATLLRRAGIELTLLHLVRDSRGWAWSSRRRNQRIGSGHGALLWNLFNVYGETAWRRSPRYLRLRYEDLAGSPRAPLERALGLAGLGAPLPFTGPNEAAIEPGHSCGGNENRFVTGSVTIRPDEAWRERLSARDFALVTALTWPLLLRYGYRLRRKATASESTPSVPATIRPRE